MSANHMSMGDKTCFVRWPNLPTLEQNVWEVKYSMFMSDVLVHLHQGLLLSSTNIDANKTAVVPDLVLNVADDSCTNATVGYTTIKPGSVACVIVNDSRPF